MKHLLLLLLIFTNTLFAATVDLNGMGRIRSFLLDNYDLKNSNNDKHNYTSYRFQFGITAKQNADSPTSFFLQPRFNKVAGQDNNGVQSSGGVSAGTENSFGIHQAFIRHNFTDKIQLTSGRQELIYGDELLVGAVAWSDIGRAFDGHKLRITTDKGLLDIFSMTLKEVGTVTNKNRDYDFNGIYFATDDQLIKDTQLDFYYLNKQDLSDAVNLNKKIVNTSGARIKSQISNFKVRAEASVQDIKVFNSTDNEYTKNNANQVDVEAGYQWNKIYFAVEHSSASKYFDQLYPTAHKWLGFADLFKRQNITQDAIHFKYMANAKINYHVSYHRFSTVDKSTTSHLWQAPSNGQANKSLGDELDFVVNYKLSDNLNMQGVYASFMPGESYKDVSLKDKLDYYYIQLQTKF